MQESLIKYHGKQTKLLVKSEIYRLFKHLASHRYFYPLGQMSRTKRMPSQHCQLSL
ncbi:conserved hypothetical protein [Ricinus communis]|uniref:Uncharacterized protein n=1 Tax=Ricinus communis TaxID=3988 RepID=B9SXV0_RICCO|nr:conserved hypothetical protein [Ricinus communis]